MRELWNSIRDDFRDLPLTRLEWGLILGLAACIAIAFTTALVKYAQDAQACLAT